MSRTEVGHTKRRHQRIGYATNSVTSPTLNCHQNRCSQRKRAENQILLGRLDTFPNWKNAWLIAVNFLLLFTISRKSKDLWYRSGRLMFGKIENRGPDYFWFYFLARGAPWCDDKLGLGYLWIETELASLGFWSLDIISSVIEMKSYQFLHFKPFRNCILRLKTSPKSNEILYFEIFFRDTIQY